MLPRPRLRISGSSSRTARSPSTSSTCSWPSCSKTERPCCHRTQPKLGRGTSVGRRWMSKGGSAFVEFIDVQKTYDGRHMVVKDLNLALERNEFLTLLGPSGSGKTTCLMMVAGFETPTHGDIVVDGQSLTRVPAHRRDIGMVFQNYALFPHMTVVENVAFPLEV